MGFRKNHFSHCSEADQAEWRDAAAAAPGLTLPGGLACVSLALPDFAGRIKACRDAGRITLALATAAQGQARADALAAGLDEFLTTGPIDPAELAARLRYLGSGDALPPDLRLDASESRVVMGGRAISLREREAKLLRMLWNAKGGFVTHAALLAGVWDEKAVERREYLRVAIKALRDKLEPEPDMPRYLLSESAIG